MIPVTLGIHLIIWHINDSKTQCEVISDQENQTETTFNHTLIEKNEINIELTKADSSGLNLPTRVETLSIIVLLIICIVAETFFQVYLSHQQKKRLAKQNSIQRITNNTRRPSVRSPSASPIPSIAGLRFLNPNQGKELYLNLQQFLR